MSIALILGFEGEPKDFPLRAHAPSRWSIATVACALRAASVAAGRGRLPDAAQGGPPAGAARSAVRARRRSCTTATVVFSRLIWRYWGGPQVVIPDLAITKANFEAAARRGIDVCKRYFPYFTLYAVMIRKFGNRPRYEMSAIPATGDDHVCGIEFSPLLEGADYSRDHFQRFKNAIYDVGLDLGGSYYRFGGVMKPYVRRMFGDEMVDRHRAMKQELDPAFILNRDVVFDRAGGGMSELNFGDCIGCGLCILGCPAYEETGFDVLTARGRNKALQAGLAAPDMVESIWACTLCGYCDAICPSDVHNVEIVLHLRRELAGCRRAPAPARHARPRGARALVLGCTIRERAPHLIPSIHEFLRRIGRPSSAPTDDGLLRLARGRGRARAAVARQGRRRRRPDLPRAVRRRVPRRAGHAAPRPLRSRAAVLLLRAPPARESRSRARRIRSTTRSAAASTAT